MYNRGFLLAALVGLASALGAAASEPALLVNGDFEAGGPFEATGWGAARGYYSFVPGEGRNGTRALFYELAPGSAGDAASQAVPLKPGVRYVVEGWVRTENVAGGKNGMGGIKISVQWRKVNGSRGGGKFSEKKRGTSKGFEKVTFAVLIPDDAVDCRLIPIVQPGVTGRVWFDDFSIRPVDRKPICAVVSDAYRNVAVSGKARLTASVLLPSGRGSEKSVRGVFCVPCADGKTERLTATFDGAYASVDLDVSRLAVGRTKIVFRLENTKGELLDEKPLDFERVTAPPDWPVRLEKSRLLVDGRPFFPIGVYIPKIDAATLAEVKKGAFNCVLAYKSATREELDLAAAAGLKVIYSVKGTYFGTKACKGVIRSEAEEYAWLRNCIQEHRNHPALLAWYVNDELDVAYRDRLVRHRDFVAELDPGHPTYSVMYQVDDFPEYVGTYDVVGSDPYPISTPEGSSPISKVTDDTRVTVAAACGGGVWQVPQIFDWGAYRKADAARTRAPTAEEMRNMFWQCVAAGANGLIPYCLDGVRRMDARDPYDVQWKKICDLTREIAAAVPVLTSAEPAPDVTGVPANVGVRAWRKDGRTHVLCVNLTREPVVAAVEVAGHGKVKFSLGPIGVELRELKQ